MKPQTIGRVLGIGTRVAGRAIGRTIMGPDPTAARSPAVAPSNSSRPMAGKSVILPSRTGQAVRQGLGGFLGALRRAGGIVWLEVTGVFFLLPVLVFAPALWRESLAYRHTSDHKTFWVTALIVVVFLYLGVSSFWRARKR